MGRIFRFENIEVDAAKACVRSGGTEQIPRAKVFRVLMYLLENRDRVVTREELIQNVWKRAAISEDVVVHCVTEIRGLLGDSPKSPRFVRTYPGIGYRFVAAANEVQTANREMIGPTTASVSGRRIRPWALWWCLVIAAAVVAVMLVARTKPHADPSPGEIAWWRFDEGRGTQISDSSGHWNLGVLRGGATWVPGRMGAAIKLDGNGSYVEGLSGQSLPAGSGPRTVALWFRTPTTNGDTTTLFAHGRGTPYNTCFSVGLSGNGMAVAGYATQQATATNVRLDDDQWHFVAGVYEGTATNVARVYVDGSYHSALKLASAIKTKGDAPWWIGSTASQGTSFRGVIDDVRVYHQVLTATDLLALYRCSSERADLRIGGQEYYFLPVFVEPVCFMSGGGDQAHGRSYAGVEFAKSDGRCSYESLRGASLSQDLSITVDLLTPPGEKGSTSAGPFFRSRRAAPGDGTLGGTSAGYWVQLHSTGMVTVRRLNPQKVVAFAQAATGFDPNQFHRLEVDVQGELLQVRLDGNALEFDEGGRRVQAVSIPPVWNGPPATGRNDGTAGIGFASEPRFGGTGQRARGLAVTVLDK